MPGNKQSWADSIRAPTGDPGIGTQFDCIWKLGSFPWSVGDSSRRAADRDKHRAIAYRWRRPIGRNGPVTWPVLVWGSGARLPTSAVAGSTAPTRPASLFSPCVNHPDFCAGARRDVPGQTVARRSAESPSGSVLCVLCLSLLSCILKCHCPIKTES